MEFLKEFLGDELYAQVVEKLNGHEDKVKVGNLATGDYIARGKYDKDLKEKDQKIQELTDSIKNFDGVDVAGLQTQVKDWEAKYAADMAQAKIDGAISLAIAKSGTRSEKALFGMIDKSLVKMNDKGEISGLDDQIEAIKKDNDFLFNPVQAPAKPAAKDVNLGGNHGGGSPKADDKPMSMIDAVNAYYGN